MTKLPIKPANPERVCWGCDKYCPADDLACGNGTVRTAHPCELFGDDWLTWERRRPEANRNRAPAQERLQRLQILDEIVTLSLCDEIGGG